MKKLWILIFICLFAACSKAPQESAEQKDQTPEVYKPQVTFADAIKQSDETAVRYYLAQGESPNQLDDDGTPFLVLAAAQDNKEIVNAILAAHVPIDAKNTRGEDALWTAVNNGNYDIAELLIILGADVNTKNQDNMTPLMVASQNGYILNVEQLLKSGADITAKNNQNKTALDLAQEQLKNTTAEDAQTYKDIIAMLKTYSEPVIPAAVHAIATSDVDTFENLAPRIKNLPEDKQGRLLWMAAGVCVPNTKQICHLNDQLKKTEFPCITKGIVCNKENNARIIRTLLANGAPSDGFAIEDKNNMYPPLDADTVSYRLQKANPELLVELMPKLDKCMLALTQMSHPNPKETDDGFYSAFWLKNECSLSKMNFLGVEFYEQKNRPTVSILPEKDFNEDMAELGLGREALIKKIGEPNFEEQKNASTEILTYRKAENIDKTQLVIIVDYNYMLKRGVVIKKDRKVLAYGVRPYVDREKIAQYETKRGY